MFVQVQYLNYYRCTICSNMVIPSFMYKKHLELHREKSDSFEFHYKCVCGNIFESPSGFRLHINVCGKKGVLPPQWEFLKKKLKAHEVVAMEHFLGRKDNAKDLKNFSSDSQLLKVDLKTEMLHESGKIFISNIELDTKDTENNSIKLKSNDDLVSTNKELSYCTAFSEEEIQEAHSVQLSNSLNSSHLKLLNLKINSVFETELSKKESDSQCSDGCLVRSISSNDNGKNENNQSDLDIADIELNSIKVYDHIPCDHLGYAKLHGSEINKKESKQTNSYNRSNYDVIVELDESTGLFVSKRVHVEDTNNGTSKDGSAEDDITIMSYKGQENTKKKNESKSSIFSCPFCVVLFPKNDSTLQQFRRHIECYHDEAALNMTISSAGNEFIQNVFEPVNVNFASAFENSNVISKICNEESGTTEEQFQSKSESINCISQNLEDEKSLINSHSQKIICNADESSFTSKFLDDEKENSYKASNKNIIEKLSSNSDLFWTLKLSLCHKNSAKENINELKEKTAFTSSCGSNADALSSAENKMLDFKKKEEEEKCLETFFGKSNFETVTLMRKLDCSNGRNKTSNTRYHDDCNRFSLKDDSRGENESSQESLVEKNCENVESNGKSVNCSNEWRLGLSDYEKEFGNSKDSSWGCISEFSLDPENFDKSEFSDDSSKKTKGFEKSRRESEVWSDLYKSLQLAEKLKKNKEKKIEIETETKKKFFNHFSSKRVVKKPKRYRHSSESEYSFYENEASESENETKSLNDSLMNERDSGGGLDGDSEKKKKLLEKLENIDRRFLDYLLNLIAKKEKCIHFYERQSPLTTNRRSQDLRSYRKKVLNGIKLRGNSLKLRRYQQLTRKKTHGDRLEICKEAVYEKCDSENSNVLEPKVTNEKKRGRPRKLIKVAKLKERRRSDKEIGFIEKNFQSEEIESSMNKRKRKLSSKLQYYKRVNIHEERDDFSSGQVISSKSSYANKKFCCAVCKESFSDSGDFRTHISIHRLEENSYQCMECGECFVVRPSLEKHLLAFHKIKNTGKYIAENECCNPKKETVECENEPVKENQCKVCKDQFDRATDLAKHFRIHGMAFLKEFKKDSKLK